MENKKYDFYDVYEFGSNELCNTIQAESNIKVNKYGYKLMGYLDRTNDCIVFDGKEMRKITIEQFINFSRERKLNYILK